jgi:Sec-independent protein secretion pathway component TatC
MPVSRSFERRSSANELVDSRTVLRINDKLIATTALNHSRYVGLALRVVCVSVPFLLWQIWAFVSPGLYP